jgi:SAM-dependent methyltransferase
MACVETEPRPSKRGGPDANGPNAAMVEHWNRVVGPGWVAGQAAIDAHLAPFLTLAIERAEPRPGERVLDVGCGCGATSLALAERVGERGRVVGVDISAPMLARAQERARSAGLGPIEFLNADAQTAEIGDGFDLVFSRFGVMFFSDFPGAFRNLRESLAPGGRICFVCWRAFERNGWMGVPMAAAARHIPVADPVAPGNPGPYGLADGDRLSAWLCEAGFESPELESLDIGLPVRGGVGIEAAADFMTSMGPVAGALREAGESWREPVRQAVLEGMRPFEKPEGVVLPASCWRVFARNPAAQ